MTRTTDSKPWLQRCGVFALLLLANSAMGAVPPEGTGPSSPMDNPPVLTDPTQPNWFGLSKTKSKPKGPVLNSLVTGTQRRIAVINGELMREGDSRHGITIQEILADRVLITTSAGSKKVLKLKTPNYPAKIPRENKR